MDTREQSRLTANEVGQLDNRKEPEPTNTGLGSYTCRDNAKQVLQDLIFRKKRQVTDLQIIFDMLPSKLTPEQDKALWNFLTVNR